MKHECEYNVFLRTTTVLRTYYTYTYTRPIGGVYRAVRQFVRLFFPLFLVWAKLHKRKCAIAKGHSVAKDLLLSSFELSISRQTFASPCVAKPSHWAHLHLTCAGNASGARRWRDGMRQAPMITGGRGKTGGNWSHHTGTLKYEVCCFSERRENLLWC